MSELLSLVRLPFDRNWADAAEDALKSFARTRYGARWEKRIQPRVNGDVSEGKAPFAALIPAGQPDRGGYGGTSLVLFPAPSSDALVALCIGTNGLAPDEDVLGRPGHARKASAIARWINARVGKAIAWAKRDAVRIDVPLPRQLRAQLEPWEAAADKYDKYLYALLRPLPRNTGADELLTDALHAFADLFAEARGLDTIGDARKEKEEATAQWLARAVPSVDEAEVHDLLMKRRFVILEGPPGTGKTRMARHILQSRFKGRGRTIQFHPTTSYETFMGGLAPVTDDGATGLRFVPKRGHLLEAIAEARAQPDSPFLLHIDEINRADLAKVLGEAIYLFEPNDLAREIHLAHDFGEPIGRTLTLPSNLFVLGTMNSADRSIAILDVAVRRRFAFVPVWPDRRVLDGERASERAREAFERLTSIFLEEAGEETLPLMPGHAYFLDGGDPSGALLRTGLKPLLQEYLAQGYVAAFADQIRAFIDWLDEEQPR